MKRDKITLKEATRFHGHLGPYLVLGLLAGEQALKNLKCKKYFGLQVNIWGADKKPESCIIDGLQLSTGATYGKGSIRRSYGKAIKIELLNRINNQRIVLRLAESVLLDLEAAKTHRDSEALAKRLYKTAPKKIFKLTN